ncbi:hypothetical protein HHL17_24130 [Chitinophaga sp. G-6-1-13]|uniref:Uncharacterized protein n=1 Tax=Chitinophaga fulva TaxID=2728842 RepID=A0A848GQQ4_9BACT|nr:hypothetical protein [Chitinophaga fulva]NML40307.1 hypothetical protein [Chitinophaga fulva]
MSADPQKISFALEEELADAPVAFMEKYQHLLVQMAVPDDFFSICIFAGEQQVRVFEKLFGKHEDCRLLTGTMISLAPVIYQIETEKQLADAKQTIIEGNVNDGTDTFSYQMIQYRTVYPDQQLLYFEQHGYQRKQMNFRFYEDFINDHLYFSKADVLRAFEYLEPWKEAGKETVRNFQENFIDNFEEGASVFFPGW